MSKSKPTEQLTETQLEIMSLIWDRKELTVAEVWEVLKRRRGLARNTVQTMLVRLEEKGFLKHRTERNAFIYSAARARSSTLSGLLRGFVQSAFSGSTSGLIQTLLESENLSDDELKRIRALLKSKSKTNEAKK